MKIEIETIKAVRDLLTVMQRSDQIPAVRALVESHITEDHLADLDRAIRKWREPVTFRLEVPGYVLFGQGQDVFPRKLPPRMTGIYIAHAVFEAGEAAPSIVRCEDYGEKGDGMQPRGMYNALRKAAKWFEVEGCGALAVAIRGISVSDEGRPSYNGDIVVNVL